MLLLPEVIIENYNTPVADIPKPCFDSIWKAKWLGDLMEVIGIDSEKSSDENEVIAQIVTEGDEYADSLDELEPLPDDTVNSKYLDMYKYWIRGFEAYNQFWDEE